ncbi:MAG: hypothetical protein NC226_02275, partial [Bacteroides cellulosilyticus]|nr:hypothetical protein [Bacteroides cellulosilyticus]
VHVWGACGRWFESSHPDTKAENPIAKSYRVFAFWGRRESYVVASVEVPEFRAIFSGKYLYLSKQAARCRNRTT